MSARSPLALAALATVAIKGLEPVSVQPAEAAADDVDAALIEDSLQRRWLVRAPRTATAGIRMEQEEELIGRLTSWLPFALPQVEGSAALPSGGRAVVQRRLPGRPLRALELRHRPALTTAFAQAVAAVHELPARLIEESGLPTYSNEEFRLRRLTELDRAAGTGRVPARLLDRWEHAVEDLDCWRFTPCFVHGDLAGENVLVDGEKVTAVLEWSEARVADPADDLAWAAVGLDEQVWSAVLSAYQAARPGRPDPALARRARLSGEFALARWLLHGVNTGQDAIVADAVQMLTELDAGLSAPL